ARLASEAGKLAALPAVLRWPVPIQKHISCDRPLRCTCGPVLRASHTRPWLGIPWGHETIAATSRCAIGHALESIYAVHIDAATSTGDSLGNGFFRRSRPTYTRQNEHCSARRLRRTHEKSSAIDVLR